MYLFSIVLPTYNSSRFIDETVSSLLAQECGDYEIVIVDDGSADDTFDRLKKYKDRIRVYRQENKGSAAARNRGILNASGEYIASFDHDDILFPHALEIYSEVIKFFNHPPIIVAKIRFFQQTKDLVPGSWDGNSINCARFECFFKKNESFATFNSALIIRKDVLAGIHGYPLNSFGMDDSRMLFRIGNESPAIAIKYPVTVGYRQHDSNWSHNVDYLTNGIVAFIEDERRNRYPGGKKLKFDRRGLIGTNVLSMFKYYLGFRNLDRIIRIILHLRTMIFIGIIRKLASYGYKSEDRTIQIGPSLDTQRLVVK